MHVYHGSSKKFSIALPSKTRRVHYEKDKLIVDYSGISLHATKYKYLALAYTGVKNATFMHNNIKERFSFGVNIKNKKCMNVVIIFGKKSLNYSLNKIYGKGGYLYTFSDKDFKWVKGLGNNEVVSFEEQIPKKIEFIKDPVSMMRKLGVKFEFIDLTK